MLIKLLCSCHCFYFRGIITMICIQIENLAYLLYSFAVQTLNAHSRALLMQRLAGADISARFVVNTSIPHI